MNAKSNRLRRTIGLVLGLGLAWLSAHPTGALAASHAGDPEAGKQVFRKCLFCHSLKPGETRTGPSLAGLFGRRAGSVPGFKYSASLSNAGFDWDEDTLDIWIAAPREFIPGTRMAFDGLKNPKLRADLIAYLKKATQRNQ